MSSWSAKLQAFTAARRGGAAASVQAEDERAVEIQRRMHLDREVAKAALDPSYAAVPQFFDLKRAAATEVQQKVKKEARTRFLERKAEMLLDEDELERMWDLVLKHQTPPRGRTERLDYLAFRRVGELMPAKAAPFFLASVFRRFPRDPLHRVSARAFFQYVVRKVGLTQLRISITCYDEVGAGYLREQDLENYIFEQIPSLPQLHRLELDFYPYYVFTAVRKFAFFLDPMKKGKIAIRDIVSSDILREFNELRQPPPDDGGAAAAAAAAAPPALGGGGGGGGRDGGEDDDEGPGDDNKEQREPARAPPVLPPAPAADPPQQQLEQQNEGWFTSRTALKIYAMYLGLDVDHNGMLSKEEFSGYNGGVLTDVFVDRLFQECRMYRSETGRMEMDYKTFLDLVLAMQNKGTPQALQYFWKVLDVNRCGYLTLSTLNYFFKSVIHKMVELGHEPVRVEDVTNEIFDMVMPEHPHRITLADLVRSNVGHTVVSILTDVNGFWQYDNREMLIAHEPQE